MAIVNCTPDSFYAASRSPSVEEAVERALRAEAAGADLVDLGAESTRPGAAYVPEAEERRRLIPVIKALRKASRIPLSVDTRRAAAAKEALDAGADIINDISGLEDDPALGPLCAERGAPVILMHKRGDPLSMQETLAPYPNGVVEDVRAALERAAERALEAGLPRPRVILDPGIGFGKSVEDNLRLIAALPALRSLGCPVLVGLSRKSFLGAITGRGIEERLAASAAAAAAAALLGADILRVHDVPETVDALKTACAIRGYIRIGIGGGGSF
jgi:dihydropteroate synthase